MALNLKKILEQVLKEQGVGIMPMPLMPGPSPMMAPGVPPINPMLPITPMVPPPANMPPPAPIAAPEQLPTDLGIVELPDVNMSVSVFTGEKKLVFTPQDHEATTEKVKKYLNVFKKNFRIDRINSLKKGSFEVEFDPRENFAAAVEFLQKLSGHEG